MATNNAINIPATNNADGFDLSGGTTSRKLTVTGANITLTGSGTNVYTYPAATDTLVGRVSVDTLTNKTLTSPVLNTATVGTSLLPTSNDGAALGSATVSFSDLFLASGAVLNYANGNVVMTHTSGILTIGTGTLKITTPTDNTTSVLTTDGTQTLTNKTYTSPKINEAVALTTTSTKLNYLTSATGTTGTTSTNIVFSTSPTLVTPTLGVATVTSVNKVAITAPATSATLTIADGATLALSGTSVTIAGSGAAVITMPTSDSTLATLALTETLTNKTLTSPKVNEDVAVTSTATELNLVDGSVAGTVVNSKGVIYSSAGAVVATDLLIGAATIETGSANTVCIPNGTAPDAHVDNEVILYSADTTDNTATLGIYSEQAVEDIGTFTPSHKLKIFINGTAYWIQLDAV